MRFARSSILAALLIVAPAALHAADSGPARPNILVILADDLGYADLGCQGSPDVKTPNIDSLAANGVRCTAGYVTAPQCSPSRAALMSGRYQQRFGHESNSQSPVMLMSGARTMADHLKAAGYATGHFGKWHLGPEMKPPAPGDRDSQHPLQHGFDESFGYFDYQAGVEGGGVKVRRNHGRDDRVFADKAKELRELHERWVAQMPPIAPGREDPSEGDEGAAAKPPKRKARAAPESQNKPNPAGS